jgi:nitroreductase
MDAIKKRRSVRHYLPDPIEDDKLQRILEAGRLAPSSMNHQNWRFVVVRSKDHRQELVEVARGQKFVGDAPVVIAACATDPTTKMGCGEPSYAIDLAIAVDHMTLVAAEEGLGTCWVGNFDQEKASRLLKVPAPAKVVFLLPVGYSAKESGPRPRKPLDEVVSEDAF